MTEVDILIIGAGAAGLSCGKSAIAAGAGKVLIVDTAPRLGGILPQCLHRGFGLQCYGEEMNGKDFLDRMVSELPEELDIWLSTTVLSVSADKTALLSSAKGLETVHFRQLILATGCREVSLWSLGIGGTRPRGVFPAGLAQQLINLDSVDIGEKIVILGSGDVGLVMAGRFAELGKKPLCIIELKPQLGGLVRNQKRYIYSNIIPVMLSSTVTELHGDKLLTGITVCHLDSGEPEEIECDTLITALGLIPDRSLITPLMTDGLAPSWIHFAGNCDFVHDIVDRVLRNGEQLGNQAARLL